MWEPLPRAAPCPPSLSPSAHPLLPCPPQALQEFLLEVQTSGSAGGGSAGTAPDLSQIALMLAEQLALRRDEEAAQLTALRCAL